MDADGRGQRLCNTASAGSTGESPWETSSSRHWPASSFSRCLSACFCFADDAAAVARRLRAAAAPTACANAAGPAPKGRWLSPERRPVLIHPPVNAPMTAPKASGYPKQAATGHGNRTPAPFRGFCTPRTRSGAAIAAPDVISILFQMISHPGNHASISSETNRSPSDLL